VSPAPLGDVAGDCVHLEGKDSGTRSSGGDVAEADVAEDGGLDDVEARHWCKERIPGIEGVVLPPTADLVAVPRAVAARDCCRGGLPTCARCLGIAEGSTSHLRADVGHQAKLQRERGLIAFRCSQSLSSAVSRMYCDGRGLSLCCRSRRRARPRVRTKLTKTSFLRFAECSSPLGGMLMFICSETYKVRVIPSKLQLLTTISGSDEDNHVAFKIPKMGLNHES